MWKLALQIVTFFELAKMVSGRIYDNSSMMAATSAPSNFIVTTTITSIDTNCIVTIEETITTFFGDAQTEFTTTTEVVFDTTIITVAGGQNKRRALSTTTTTVIIPCASPTTVTDLLTTELQKITVTQLVTETLQIRITSTVPGNSETAAVKSCDTLVTQTITSPGPESTTTITLTAPAPLMKKEAQELASTLTEVSGRGLALVDELAERALLPSSCTVFQTVSGPGPLVTVTSLLFLTKSSQPPSKTTLPQSISAFTTSNVNTPTHIGQSFTTTIGTIPATVVSVSESSLALVNGATLSQGGPAATIDNQVVSFGPSGLVVSSNGYFATSAFTTTLGLASLTVTELPGKAIVNGATLSQGGPATTVGNQVISYGPSGLVAIDTGSLTTFTTMIGPAVLSVTELPGEAIVNGATLSQGGMATTINGQVISFGPSGLVALGTGTLASSAFTTNIGGAALTVTQSPGKAIVDGATLSKGGADTTINGVVVTYGPSGLIASPTGAGTTAAVNLGEIIMSIFGLDESGSTSEIAIGTQLLTQAGGSPPETTKGSALNTLSMQATSTGVLQLASGSVKERASWIVGIASLIVAILIVI